MLLSFSLCYFIYLCLPFFVVPFYSVIRQRQWKIEELPLGGFFYVRWARQRVTIALFAVYWFYLFLQIVFLVTLPAATMPLSDFNLKFRGQDNSPTHHFLRGRVEPRQENTEQGPLPCAPCLGSATHNLPLCGLSPSLKIKKDRKRQS